MKKSVSLFIVFLVLSSLACSFVSRLFEEDIPVVETMSPVEVEPVQPEPTQPEPTATPEQDSKILFEDDFSDTTSGWDRTTKTEGETDYYNDSYRIFVNEANRFYFANPGLTDLPNDVRVEVEATKIGGPDDNSFGIICRYQDVNNFYRFLVSSDGYAGIILVLDGETTNLTGENLTQIDSALLGEATNNIRVDCIGNNLSLFVNGDQAFTIQDSTFSDGDVGLFAGSFDVAGADVLFDNFVVTQP